MIKLKFKGDSYSRIARPAIAPLCASLLAKKNKKVNVILCDSLAYCESVYEKLNSFLKMELRGDFNLKIFPPANSNIDTFESYCMRASVIGALQDKKSKEQLIILTTTETLFERFLMPSENSHKILEVGEKISIKQLSDLLSNTYDYYNEVLCEGAGQYALRGSIVDVYPISALSPYRIDFFGNEIESIKTFDIDSQLTKNKVDSIRIDSASSKNEKETVLVDFLPSDGHYVFIDVAFIYRDNSSFFMREEKVKTSRGFAPILDRGASFSALSTLDTTSGLFGEDTQIHTSSLQDFVQVDFRDLIASERVESEERSRLNFYKKLGEFEALGYDIFIEKSNDTDMELVGNALNNLGQKLKLKFVPTFYGEGFIIDFKKSNFRLDSKAISKKASGVVFLSFSEFFGRKNKVFFNRKTKPQKTQIDKLLDFSELVEGDFLVHLAHGICKYMGMSTLNTPSGTQETVKLEFDEGAFLYVPLHNVYLLTRYLNLDKKYPKLSKIDAKAWTKVRLAAEKASLDYASELLEMQAKRESLRGIAFPENDKWQSSFDDSFEFTETPDQLNAIGEVYKDMQIPHPMDRLICADVGFGKTEIAMRAAFKAASSGKQVAILCPTTILCQQHFLNFKERFAPYPIIIESLSRFNTRAESNKIKAQLATGKIDIIIATHAMLSKDVTFRDIGLLIVDEEHRFGVKNKEKIKKFAANVDILTMSATPIPRTLYFAMMGAKQMSVMQTPPRDRLPVETFIQEYDLEVIRKAIAQEIDRKGQVFYLHNRVKTIDNTVNILRNMFPDLKIEAAHGQMDEKELEAYMCRFIEGEYDILVCTTIIESGIDIPNCNTIIIESADKFGLAQLYQLRGRVGRFNRQAYAYLLLDKKDKMLTNAKERLSAIREYNKPGSGFQIAAKDLQLRGCGNILGAKQSGHISGVGFDLYCSLLKQSVARLKGDRVAFAIRAKIDLDFIKLGDYEANMLMSNRKRLEFDDPNIYDSKGELKRNFAVAMLSQDYIPQSQIRMDMYRRIALVESEAELDELKVEIADRFGKIPKETDRLFTLARIRLLAEFNSFSTVNVAGDTMKLQEAFSSKNVYFRVAGMLPKLSATKPDAKLKEIINFLRYTIKSLAKKPITSKK